MSAALRSAVICAAASLLGACQSSPATHYFALAEIAPSAARATLSVQIPIRVERVTIPGELDRLELVRRSTSNQLQIATFERWAAPLEDMIRRVAAADLAARFAPGTMASPNEPAAGEPRRHLYIDVQEFAADEHGAVTLHAAWLLQTPNAASARGAEEVAVEARSASGDAVAAAMSRALAGLTDRIAAALAAQAESKKSE
ncbi:MAG TPA: PqiC family protein [Steroidobacteraceae bacterium]|jgi:uncharacterized lipoprotein YmbA|nr:PqiC family protein [Steroidobacteraceae bacterium]